MDPISKRLTYVHRILRSILYGVVLDIAATKLRTFHPQWGNGNLDLAPSGDPAQRAPPDTLLVHTGRWIPQTVRLASTGVMKHLGVHWDMQYDGASIYQLTLDNLEAAISRLRTFPRSPEFFLLGSV